MFPGAVRRSSCIMVQVTLLTLIHPSVHYIRGLQSYPESSCVAAGFHSKTAGVRPDSIHLTSLI